MEQTEIVMFIVRKVAWHLITFKKLCLTKNIYYTINVIAHRKSIITCISLIHFNTSCLGTFKFFHRLNTTLYLSFSFFSDAFLKTTRITTAASVSLSSPRIRSNVSPTFTWRGGKGGEEKKITLVFFSLSNYMNNLPDIDLTAFIPTILKLEAKLPSWLLNRCTFLWYKFYDSRMLWCLKNVCMYKKKL